MCVLSPSSGESRNCEVVELSMASAEREPKMGVWGHPQRGLGALPVFATGPWSGGLRPPEADDFFANWTHIF